MDTYSKRLEIREKEFIKERELFEANTNRKMKIELPHNKKLTVTNEFLGDFPSFMLNMVAYMNNIKQITTKFVKSHHSINKQDLKMYLLSISVQIFNDVFTKNASDVRIHFRVYDASQDGYKKFVSVIASKESFKNMMFIPRNEKNLITKSYECKRALIGSFNEEFNYTEKPYSVWEEYITLAFNNTTQNDIPYLSFGISLKNKRYKNLLCFLNYFQFETYLQEVIDQIDEKFGIEKLLYGE